MSDGWYLAIISNFTIHKDGNVTIHFSIQEQQTAKAKLTPEKLRLLFQLLNLQPPRDVNRHSLQPLLNKQVAIKLETKQFTNEQGITITYSKVTSIRKDLPEEAKQSQFFHQLLEEYLLSTFGWVKI